MNQYQAISLLPNTDPGTETTLSPHASWTVLTVEDNLDYQRSLLNTLVGITYKDRKLNVLTANSALEASNVLANQDDIALVLLDVVMEDDQAGLRLVDTIREVQGNSQIRIVILTGQPGSAPEDEVLDRYDIDHYYEKSQLSPKILRSLIRQNLKSWEHINYLYRAKKGLQMILDATRQIHRHQNLNRFTDEVLSHIGRIAELDDAAIICTYSEDGSHFQTLSSNQHVMESNSALTQEDIPVDLLAEAYKAGDHVFSNDCTILCFCDKEHINGAYLVYVQTQKNLAEYALYLLRVFSENVRTGFINVTLNDRLTQYAYYDSDLNIYNRQRLQRELMLLHVSTRQKSQLLTIKISDFSGLVSALGKTMYLTYLEAVHQRMLTMFPKATIWGRFSPDSLAYLLTEESTDLEQIRLKLQQPYDDIVEFHLRVSVLSVPLAEFPDNDTEHWLNVVEAVESYMQKKDITIMCYQQSFDQAREDSIYMVQALYKDIRAKKLDVHFQPKVEIETGAVVGCESLCRWKYNDQLVSPEIFIPLAKEAGVIEELDSVVVDKVLQHSQQLHELGIDLPLSINMVPSEAFSSDYLDSFIAKVTSNKAPRTELEVEITEEEPVKDYSVFNSVMTRLSQAGVRVSIDDFGKGYSSLTHIAQLKFDVIKIDRALVNDVLTNESSRVAIGLCVGLAQRLDVDLIAEGIETQEQADKIRELGVNYGQGYLYAKPMPFSELVDWLHAKV